MGFDDNGIIQLSGRKLDTVVLEYAYDVLKNVGSVDDLEIDTFFGDALEKFILKEIISPRRSVGITEKEVARRDFREALLKAKLNSLKSGIRHYQPFTANIIKIYLHSGIFTLAFII